MPKTEKIFVHTRTFKSSSYFDSLIERQVCLGRCSSRSHAIRSALEIYNYLFDKMELEREVSPNSFIDKVVSFLKS